VIDLPLLLAIHAAATWFMVGLVVFVQVVHYPLYDGVPEERFGAYHDRHLRRTLWVVGPPMLIEAGAAVALIGSPDLGALPLVGALLLAAVWGSTVLLQIPAHRALERGWDARAHRRLVGGNVVRTLAWAGRGVVATALLA
jgi:hypothetical protein